MTSRENSFWSRLIFERRYRLLRHILFWMVYLVVFSSLSASDLGKFVLGFYTTGIYLPEHLIYTYFILYWLVPRFMMKGKYGQFFVFYFAWAIVGLFLNFGYRYYILIPLRAFGPNPTVGGSSFRQVFALFSCVVMNTVAMFGVFIRMFKFWYMEQKQKMQIEQEKVSAELELLKAQLHPHFLFNTLNNLYSLVLEKSDKAPDMLMRLSALLTYVLYECKADQVLLEKEVKVIKDYVALEQERYGDRLDTSMDFSGNIEGTAIAPMLFQPFVENAFKHGSAEQLGRVWMSIELSVKNHQLFFRVINSADNNRLPETRSSGGIGISNVRRRLELLYPGRFILSHEVQEEVYIVSLTIELKAEIINFS